MEKLMSDIILTAKNFSENFKECGDFDFSIESLGAVETLLDELSGYSLNEAGLQDASSMIGSYVFEVARRNYGGEYFWIEEEEQPLLILDDPFTNLDPGRQKRAMELLQHISQKRQMVYLTCHEG